MLGPGHYAGMPDELLSNALAPSCLLGGWAPVGVPASKSGRSGVIVITTLQG